MQERLEKEKKKQMGTGSIAKSPMTASAAMPLAAPAPILPEDVVGGEGGGAGGGIFDNPPTAEAPMDVTAAPDATVDGAVATAVAAAVAAAAAAAASASAAAPTAASAEMEADVAKTLVSYKSVSDAAENSASV